MSAEDVAPLRIPTLPERADIVGDVTAEEQATIGAVILAASSVQDRTLTIVQDDDFADPRCRFVIEVVRTMRAEHLPVDLVTLLGYVNRHALLDSGAPRGVLGSWLHEMTCAAPVPASAGYYAELVVEAAARRRAQEAVQAIASAAEGDSLSDLLAVVQAELAAVLVAVERVGGGVHV